MAVDPQDLEELCRLFEELYPDPVDVFEDELAAEIGLVRHPALSQGEWRRVRVIAINAAECTKELTDNPRKP